MSGVGGFRISNTKQAQGRYAFTVTQGEQSVGHSGEVLAKMCRPGPQSTQRDNARDGHYRGHKSALSPQEYTPH